MNMNKAKRYEECAHLFVARAKELGGSLDSKNVIDVGVREWPMYIAYADFGPHDIYYQLRWYISKIRDAI